jgi:glycosyltransferase involved in cell wall biosynthesis
MPPGWRLDVVVVANGCTDRSVAEARAFRARARDRYAGLSVLELDRAGKAAALSAPAVAHAQVVVYVDADVVVGPTLLAELIGVLDVEEPRYASGTVRPVHTGRWTVDCYSRVWAQLPFARVGVPGCGLYAVNAAGRRRWGPFPEIIADDMFARLNFRPQERFQTAAEYCWPLPQKLRQVVHIRQRWIAGNRELARSFSDLSGNEAARRRRDYLATFAMMPVASAVYCLACVASKVLLGRRRRAAATWAFAPRTRIGNS